MTPASEWRSEGKSRHIVSTEAVSVQRNWLHLSLTGPLSAAGRQSARRNRDASVGSEAAAAAAASPARSQMGLNGVNGNKC